MIERLSLDANVSFKLAADLGDAGVSAFLNNGDGFSEGLDQGLLDRNDLELLTGRADHIPDSLAHQSPRYRGHKGNRTGPGVGFILAHDPVFLDAAVVAPERHRAAKGDHLG